MTDRFGQLVAMLVDQPELVARLGVVRIDGGGFQHAAEVLTAAHALAEAGELASQITIGVEQEEGRGQVPEIELTGPQKNMAPTSGIQDRNTTPAAVPLSTPKTVRTAKNISTAKYRYDNTATTVWPAQGLPRCQSQRKLRCGPGHRRTCQQGE